jgi:glyoxylase-like metal-dependent hydrolase (beta-lactamase superfamily II)
MTNETLQENPQKNISCQCVAPDVLCVTVLIANICIVGKPAAKDGEWTLVDTGLVTSEDNILRTVEARFGKAKPAGIVLTHGHFDHVGAVKELADYWNVPVYAHAKELPYLTGRKDYPEPDSSVGGGLMARLAPLYPNEGIDLGNRIKALPEDGTIPSMPGWRWIHTPGHTPGHISLFRDSDRVLIAGDAFTTVKQESAMAVLMQEREVHGPPTYFTIDWDKARESVQKLELLNPSLVITGHGQPMCGKELSKQLEELAEDFNELAVPEKGKYVHR